MEILYEEKSGWATKRRTHYDSFEEYCALHPISPENPEGTKLARAMIKMQMEQGIYEFDSIEIDNTHPEMVKLHDSVWGFIKKVNLAHERTKHSKLEFKTAY